MPRRPRQHTVRSHYPSDGSDVRPRRRHTNRETSDDNDDYVYEDEDEDEDEDEESDGTDGNRNGNDNDATDRRRLQRRVAYHQDKYALEREGLFKTYPLPKASQQVKRDQDDTTIGSTWSQFRATWNDGDLSLHVVHASEYCVMKDGREKIKLVCPDRADEVRESASVQLKWIHLQRSCLGLSTFKKLVVEVPFISPELRKVARTVLEDAEKVDPQDPNVFGGFRNREKSILRGTGKNKGSEEETEPVFFLSSPYLAATEPPAVGKLDQGQYVMNLLQSFYGFDIGTDQPPSKVLEMTNVGTRKAQLHVPRLWCLLVGPDLLMTFSELSILELCGDLVEIDSTAGLLSQPLTIRVTDDRMRRFNIVIDQNSSYLDFFRDAVALTRRDSLDATDYELLDARMIRVTPQRWLKLLGSGKEIEKREFYVFPRVDDKQQLARRRGYPGRMPHEIEGPQQGPGYRAMPYGDHAFYRETDRYGETRPNAANDMRSAQYTNPFAPQLGSTASVDPTFAMQPWNTAVSYGSRAVHRSHQRRTTVTPQYYGGYDDESSPESVDSHHRNMQLVRVERGSGSGSPRRAPQTSLVRPDQEHLLQRARRGGRIANVDPAESQSRKPQTFVLESSSDEDPERGRADAPAVAGSTKPNIAGHTRTWQTKGEERKNGGRSEKQKQEFRPGRDDTHVPGSTHSTDNDDSDSDEDAFPKPGTTPLRGNLVSIHAIRELGYPFEIAGGSVIILRALSKKRVEELIQLSKSYNANPPVSGADRPSFFTWNEGNDGDGSKAPDPDAVAVRTLSRLHKLISNGKIKKLYNEEAFLPTLSDVARRHERFLQEKSGNEKDVNVPGDEATKKASNDGSVPENIHSTADSPPSPLKNTKNEPMAYMPPTVELEDSDASERDIDDLSKPPAVNARSRMGSAERDQSMPPTCQVLMKRLLEVSQDLIADFIPTEGSALVHHVSKRLWGCVDDILRNAAWSIAAHDESPQWRILDFSHGSTTPLPVVGSGTPMLTFSQCEACRHGKWYETYDAALSHLHSQHIPCPSTENTPECPSDDPCSVWLEPSKQVNEEDGEDGYQPRQTATAILEEFVNSLLRVKSLTYEIHSLVARPSPKEPKQHNTTTHRGSPLPANLVYAFEELLSVYMMTAKRMSTLSRYQTERRTDSSTRFPAARTNKMQHKIDAALASALGFLEMSRTDMILLGTEQRGGLNALGFDAVGAEFLVAALVTQLQNRPLCPDTSPDTVVEVYRRHVQKIQYQASRRPQRRIFLDLNSLEGELEALDWVYYVQRRLLLNYGRLLDPRSHRMTTATREGHFEVESPYLNAQLQKLYGRISEVRSVWRKASMVREQVRQTIEVVEEGHGRAIRVFTVVTLLFLPLSFTCSFFGMNTTDVRDTTYDQKMYWAVSIPIAVVVLGLAFAYAYGGDAIWDRTLDTFSSPNKANPRTPRNAGAQPRRSETWLSAMSAADEEMDVAEEKARGNMKMGEWLRQPRMRRDGRRAAMNGSQV